MVTILIAPFRAVRVLITLDPKVWGAERNNPKP